MEWRVGVTVDEMMSTSPVETTERRWSKAVRTTNKNNDEYNVRTKEAKYIGKIGKKRFRKM